MLARVRHRKHRGLEDLTPRHLDVVRVILEQRLVRGMRGAATRAVQQLRERPVRLHVARQDPPPVRAPPHDRRAGAVAEQHGRGTIRPVHDAGELLGGHDQDRLRLLRGDQPLRHVEPVEPPGARGSHVEGGRAVGAEDRLEIAGLRGQQAVGGAGREDDGVEVGRREPVALEHALGRRLRHAGVRLVRLRHPPLANTGALHDPLVRRLQALRELVVRHHALRRVAANAPELGDRTLHRTAPPSANSASMSSSR